VESLVAVLRFFGFEDCCEDVGLGVVFAAEDCFVGCVEFVVLLVGVLVVVDCGEYCGLFFYYACAYFFEVVFFVELGRVLEAGLRVVVCVDYLLVFGCGEQDFG